MRIGFDIAQTCGRKTGCGWVADCLAREFLRFAPQHDYAWYHHFDSWINVTTDGAPFGQGRVLEPFKGMPPGEASARWAEIRDSGRIPGNPEIVHAHSFNAPRLRGARLVFTAHDVSFWVHPEYTTDLNRLTCQRGVANALANADGFFFLSQHARSEFERMTGGWLAETRRPCLVHPLAPRHPRPDPAWKKDTQGAWLVVGSLEPRKNLEFLLDSYRIYANESPRPRALRIIGSYGWMSTTLVDRVATWSHGGSVQATGYVDDDALLEEYRRAFCLLFPSHYEGFGLPVLEAMQQHTPVICGRVASLPEVGGDAAIYADISDARSFAGAMLDLEARESMHGELGDACARHALEFTWEGLVKAMEAFYRELLQSPRAARERAMSKAVPKRATHRRAPGVPGDTLSVLSNAHVMSPAPNPPVDIDILMERIRSEAVRRRTESARKAAKDAARPYTLGTPLRFGEGGTVDDYLASGWSKPEPGFQWTDGMSAELVFKIEGPVPELVLTFRAYPMLGGEIVTQEVSASWNGVSVGQWSVTEEANHHTLILSAPSSASSVCRLTFHMPQSFSPLSKNQGADPRRLGLAFRELVLRPANQIGFTT